MSLLYIIGDGGHSKVVAQAAALTGWAPVFISQASESNQPIKRVVEREFLISLSSLPSGWGLVCGVGSTGSLLARRQILIKYRHLESFFVTIVHPSASVEAGSQLGRGAFVAMGGLVAGGTHVGDHVIINTGAIIDHDCRIAENVHVACGAVLSGGVHLEPDVHIGAGATVVQNVRIAAQSVIGAGALVHKSIDTPALTWVGVPCRALAER